MKTTYASMGLLLLGLLTAAASAVADNLPGTGTLSGTVAAGEDVQAAQVYAHNADNQMTYMVYAIGGRYNAINLIPGTYEVRVEHPGYTSGPQQIVVESGAQATADFSLGQGGDAAPAIVGSARGAPEGAELVPYDELFPPGKGRDMLERTCMTCHGRNFISLKSGLDEAGWQALITVMLSMNDTYWGDRGEVSADEPVPFLPEGLLGTPEDQAELVAYLARHLGPGTSPRMVLNNEQAPIDEEALAKAMWIEYTAPDVTPDGGPDRRFQEQFFDLDGNVWLTEALGAGGALARLDPRTAEWSRFPYGADVFGHGVVTDPMESETILWIAGRGFDVGRLDPKTGEYTWYGDTSTTARWGGHTPVFDSKGVLWYTGIQEDRLGKWDRTTGKLTRWKIPTANGRPYGVVVDHQDNVWFGNLHTCTVTRFDQETEEFTEYVVPSAPCALRRPGLDSKGNVWYGAFSGGTIGKIDPKTDEITEYQVGRFVEPYETYVDLEDKVWISDGGQNMLIRFDPETEQFTYYPAPLPHSDRPKMHITRDGAVWYPNRGAASLGTAPAKSGVLYPDTSRMTAFGAYFAVADGRAVGTGSPSPAGRL